MFGKLIWLARSQCFGCFSGAGSAHAKHEVIIVASLTLAWIMNILIPVDVRNTRLTCKVRDVLINDQNGHGEGNRTVETDQLKFCLPTSVVFRSADHAGSEAMVCLGMLMSRSYGMFILDHVSDVSLTRRRRISYCEWWSSAALRAHHDMCEWGLCVY